MGDATLSLLDGKARVAEDVFGWNRGTVELGMNEFRTGIICVNDISKRRRLKVEEKSPKVIGRYSGNHESSQSGGIAFADDAFIYQPNAQSSTWGSFGKGVE